MPAEGLPEAAKVSVPNVVGKTLSAAESTLTDDGLTYDTPDKGTHKNTSIVKRQSPGSGTSVTSGSLVHLYISESR